MMWYCISIFDTGTGNASSAWPVAMGTTIVMVRVFCPSVCLSVCVSHVNISVTKRSRPMVTINKFIHHEGRLNNNMQKWKKEKEKEKK